LSNFDLVTESLTLIAGHSSVPAFVEPVHAGGGLFRHALDRLGDLAEPALRLFLQAALDQREQDFLFFDARLVEKRRVALLGAHAEVDEQGRVAAVVEDHVRVAAAMPVEQLGGVIPVFRQRLALDREHRNAGGRHRSGGVVLGRVDVAGDPAHVGAERREGLDQHGGLDRHVQRAGDPRTLERLRGAVFLTGGHQARHLGLGNVDFLAAEIGELDVLDDVFLGDGHDDPSVWERNGSCAGGARRARGRL
jgi:hypothetical protein